MTLGFIHDMVSFQRKKVSRAAAMGDFLKAARQKENWTIEQVAHSLGIAAKYIKALEIGRYSSLPGEIYAKNFIKRYAKLFKINPAPLLEQYAEEERKTFLLAKEKKTKPFLPSLPRLGLNPHFWRRIIILTVVVVLLIYLGLELKGIFSPPPLTLEKPAEGLTTIESELLIKGQTLPETRVQINGRAVISDLKGGFEETMNLQPGLNTITITAIKKHGPTRTIVRNVIYEK